MEKEIYSFRIFPANAGIALEKFVCKKEAGQKTCSDIFCTLNRLIFEDEKI